MGDLITINFYYFLRGGEYTKPSSIKLNGWVVHTTRTRQLQVWDIGFWKDGKILPRHSPLERLLTADSATMKIYNQNNGHMLQTIYHKSKGPRGALTALACRVSHIMIHGVTEDHLLCDYFQTKTWELLQSSDIVDAVREASKNPKLQEQVINPELIGEHSLRAGGATTLNIMG